MYIYRLEKKVEVCRVSGGGGTHCGLGAPGNGKFHIFFFLRDFIFKKKNEYEKKIINSS